MISKKIDELKKDYTVLLNYLRARFPIFHNSNFFYRDLQFGIRSFYEKKGDKLSYSESEKIAVEIARFFEENNIFQKSSSQGWKVNYPEFATLKPGDPFYY